MTADTGAGIPRTAGPVASGTSQGLPVYWTGSAPERLLGRQRRRTRECAERERTCVGCGLIADEPGEWNRCGPCQGQWRDELAEAKRRATAQRRARMAARAQAILDDPDAVVFDTETTGWVQDGGVMVQGAIVARDGTELFNRCINPGKPVSEGAFEVHGLSDEYLAAFEPFVAVWPELRRALEGRRVVIYNKAFDTEILVNDLTRLPLDVWGVPPRFPDRPDLVADQQWEQGRAWVDRQQWECAMLLYSEWFGETRALGYPEGWVWQKLPRPAGAPHDAAADCRLVWELLERLARN
jgi:DNA polymerase III epsilon subunit-like protein